MPIRPKRRNPWLPPTASKGPRFTARDAICLSSFFYSGASRHHWCLFELPLYVTNKFLPNQSSVSSLNDDVDDDVDEVSQTGSSSRACWLCMCIVLDTMLVPIGISLSVSLSLSLPPSLSDKYMSVPTLVPGCGRAALKVIAGSWHCA